jgi:hypothetical protein
MEESKTYVVICRRGLAKDTCPIIIQESGHCVECSYAGYMLRPKKENTETTEEKSENAES